MWMKTVVLLLLAVALAFGTITAFSYRSDIQSAYQRLASYDVKSIETEFGTVSYADEGSGEAILISHGIFGGYDQGLNSLRQLVGNDYRKISPSRFGYPGSHMPEQPTPENQAKVFKELLDDLGIEQAYILVTSAGGAAGLRFALDYPERLKGLILLSSAVPDKPRSADEIKEMGMTGPPGVIVNDFPMWFSMKYFGFAFNTMMGSEADANTLYETMLPVNPRRQGIAADTDVTNIDMSLHYDEYPVEAITTPILVVHAKDDPMAKYADVEKLLTRVNAQTAIFDTGGHLISGHGDDVGTSIREFVRSHA